MIISNVQQGTIEWLQLRSGKITGTTLSALMGTPKARETLKMNLLADRMAQNMFDDFTSAAMDHGNQTEDLAVAKASAHFGTDFQRVGFLESEDLPGFGMSPDAVAMVFDKSIPVSMQASRSKIIGGLETKCPTSAKHLRWIIADDLPAEHMHQVIAPFVLSDSIEYWYFMSYDYRNYNIPEFYFHVDRHYVEKYVEPCRDAIRKFTKELDDLYIELVLE